MVWISNAAKTRRAAQRAEVVVFGGWEFDFGSFFALRAFRASKAQYARGAEKTGQKMARGSVGSGRKIHH